MLVVMAATGVLRGLQDTRTPLVVAVAGFSLNIVLNVVLVYGLDLGIRGSALGTVLAQTAMALALVAVIVHGAAPQHGKALAHWSPAAPGPGARGGPGRRPAAGPDPGAAGRRCCSPPGSRRPAAT